jgi:hypothetical protein
VDRFLLQTLFLDIHFYFICYDKAQNLFKIIVNIDGNQELKNLWEKFKPLFKPYNNVRNHLEHIEERIRNTSLSDFGNLRDNIYTFGGEQFDIGPSSLKVLTDVYESINTHLSSR